MERRIMRLPVHRTSIIMACTAGIFGLAAAVLMSPFMMFAMKNMQHMSAGFEQRDVVMAPTFPLGMGMGMMIVMMPVMYFIFSYIGTAIFVFVFNFVAGRMDGLPVEFAE